MPLRTPSLALASLAVASAAYGQTTLTVATVGNPDMERMQGLSDAFTSENPDIELDWVTLDENVLRQRVTHRHRDRGRALRRRDDRDLRSPDLGRAGAGCLRWTRCPRATTSTTSCRRSATA